MSESATAALCTNGGIGQLTALLACSPPPAGAWYSGKGALRVKLYDFSVYLDEEASVRALRPLAAAASSEAATAALARSRDSEVSLVVRTARNLPLRTVKSEYRQILRRRLAKIGASSAQLRKFLDAFEPEKVPPACLEGASIKKGTQILFKKQGATTKISIGDQTIVAVRCPELSGACAPRVPPDRCLTLRPSRSRVHGHLPGRPGRPPRGPGGNRGHRAPDAPERRLTPRSSRERGGSERGRASGSRRSFNSVRFF